VAALASIVNAAEPAGYPALFLPSMAESGGVPVPGETALIAAAMERPGPFERRRRRVLETGEPFFQRHGRPAVFFGRWILGLRTWASWLAGASYMPWKSFAVWNAAGAISWATTIGLIAYFVGSTATSAITAFGLFALVAVVASASANVLLRRLRRSPPTSRRTG
jgi:membrane protein DedA with SNARE-associated domain